MSKERVYQPSLEERLWKSVDKNGPLPPTLDSRCWLWVRNPACTYGRIKRPGERIPSTVHRIVYELEIGPIPAGLLVCHKCDTPKCCNPGHLFLGTPKDNIDDMLGKFRGAGQKGTRYQPDVTGTKNGRAKLSVKDVRFIKKVGGTVLKQDLAHLFKVSRSTIKQILRGVIWKHIN